MIITELYKNELKRFFYSPMIYILGLCFTPLVGLIFYNYLIASDRWGALSIGQGVLRPFAGNINFLLLFMAPLITMGLISNEKQQGTLGLLLGGSVTPWKLTLAKAMAGQSVLVFFLLLTAPFSLFLVSTGHHDWGLYISLYLGLFLSGSFYISLGLFCSSWAPGQMISAFLSFTLSLGLLFILMSAEMAEGAMTGRLLAHFSPAFHFAPFTQGAIRSFHVGHYFLSAFFFLYLAKKGVEASRW